MSTSRSSKILAIGIVPACGILFALFGCLGQGRFMWADLGFFGTMGAVFGAMAMPELAPKLFRRPVLWQTFFCVLGFLMLAFAAKAPPEGYALAAVVGLMLGIVAPYWLKHLQLP